MSAAVCSEIVEEEAVETLRPAIFDRLRVRVKPEAQHCQTNKEEWGSSSKASVRTLASAALLGKNVYKLPSNVGPPVAAISEITESSVSLKQALRRICISQASELAALKRLSKPVSVVNAVQDGIGSKSHSSVLVQASDAADAKKGSSTRVTAVQPQINGSVGDGKTAEPSSAQKAASETKFAASETIETQKMTIQDVISKGSLHPSEIPSTAIVPEKKVEALRKTSASSPTEAVAPISSFAGLSVVKPTSQNKTTIRNKAKPDLTNLSASAQHSEPDAPASLASRLKAFLQEPITPKLIRSANGNRRNCPTGKPPSVPRHIVINSKSNELNSKDNGESSQSSKSSIGDYSSSTSISDESFGSFNGNSSKPHMSKDIRWLAVRRMVMQQGGLDLKNFKLLKRLGCGDIGTVYLAELVGSSCLFALKVMDVEFLVRRKKMLRAQTERDILQMLDHPFLPTLYSYFTTDNLSCLVMEYCPGGDLHVLRQKQPSRSFSESAARFYVAEVLLALEYLHMLGVIYRDLKPENILVRDDGHIMLSDFDLSLKCSVNPVLVRLSSVSREEPPRPSGPCPHGGCIDPLCMQSTWSQPSCFTPRLVSSKPQKAKADTVKQPFGRLPQLVAEPTDARSNSFVGTHEYLAPEIIRGDGHGSSVDWWTLGIFLYELLYGKTPFKGPGTDETLANVVSCPLKFPDDPSVSAQAKELIKGLLVKQPECRLGSMRGAAEIKRHSFFEGLNWALIRCAAPPETPRSPDAGSQPVTQTKKEGKCMTFRTHGDYDIEFELF